LRFLNRSQTCSSGRSAVGALAHLTPSHARPRRAPCGDVGLGALGLQLGQVGLELLGARLDVGVARFSISFFSRLDLVLQAGQVAVATLLVDRGDHVGREVDDLLEVLRGEVEQVAEAAGDALEVPDVGDRRGELDVAHALTAHLGAGDLDAAALADDALEADALVLAAVALPVAGGPKIFSQNRPSFSGLRVR
jgi:hypothetical protein